MHHGDLLDHGQAQAGAVHTGREVGPEYVFALFGRNAGAIIAHLETGFLRLAFAGHDLNPAVGLHGLDRVHEQIKEQLPEQLLVCVDHQALFHEIQFDRFVLEVALERANHVADDRAHGIGERRISRGLE